MQYNVNVNLAGNDHYQAKFDHLSLADAVIRSKAFEDCEFTACSFVDCKFEKGKFLNCRFSECVLSAVTFVECRFNDVRFFKCKAIGIDWTKSRDIRGLDFMESQINYSSFSSLAIPKTRIVKCEAKEVDFSESDLSHGEFEGTDFEKSRFIRTNLSYANFKDARNYCIDVRNNTLKQTHFSLPEAMSLLNSLDIKLE